MNLYGKSEQEKAMQSFIHDTNRDISSIDHVIKKLSDWLMKDAKNISTSDMANILTALEYLKRDSKNLKKDIDTYFEAFKNDFKPQQP